MASRSLKCSPSLASLRRSFRGPGRGTVHIAFVQGNVLHWTGDVLATSTSKKLEGVQRADWWGFAGRYSADAALHHCLGRSLREECRQQTHQLNFGEVLVTAQRVPVASQTSPPHRNSQLPGFGGSGSKAGTKRREVGSARAHSREGHPITPSKLPRTSLQGPARQKQPDF